MNFSIIIALILVIVGSGLSTYSFTVKVVQNDAKKSTVHWVYLAAGILLIIIGFLVAWFGTRGGCKAIEGEVCIPVTKTLAAEIKKSRSAAISGYGSNFLANSSAASGGEVNPFKQA